MPQIKKIIALISTLITSITMAGGPIIETMPHTQFFNGFYAGIGVGGVISNVSITSTSTSDAMAPGAFPIIFSSDQDSNPRLTNRNALGQIFLGYGHVFHWFFLSGEAFGNYGRVRSSLGNSETFLFPGIGFTQEITNGTTVKLNNGEGGVDGRLGFLATPKTLLYARLGASFNRVEIDSNTVGMLISIPGEVNTTGNLVYSVSKCVTGFRAGLGLEQRVGRHSALQFDYVFTDYGTFSANQSLTVPVMSPFLLPGTTLVTTNTTSVNVHTNTFLASYVYHFNV